MVNAVSPYIGWCIYDQPLHPHGEGVVTFPDRWRWWRWAALPRMAAANRSGPQPRAVSLK
jgi:hypothetical protein